MVMVMMTMMTITIPEKSLHNQPCRSNLIAYKRLESKHRCRRGLPWSSLGTTRQRTLWILHRQLRRERSTTRSNQNLQQRLNVRWETPRFCARNPIDTTTWDSWASRSKGYAAPPLYIAASEAARVPRCVCWCPMAVSFRQSMVAEHRTVSYWQSSAPRYAFPFFCCCVIFLEAGGCEHW